MDFEKALNHRVISIVGAGGKTTLMYDLAQKIAQKGKTVIATTTTNIFIPDNSSVAIYSNLDLDTISKSKYQAKFLEYISYLLSKNSICTIGKETKPGKLMSLIPDVLSINQLLEIADYIIIEADGSKHLPLKAPANHEPVIPDETTLVIGVANLSAVGKPIKETCHRPEMVVKLLNYEYQSKKITLNHIIEYKDVLTILQSPLGQRKDVGEKKYMTLINERRTSEQ